MWDWMAKFPWWTILACLAVIAAMSVFSAWIDSAPYRRRKHKRVDFVVAKKKKSGKGPKLM